MYNQQQAMQITNQLSHIQSIARQLQQAEARRQQTEQQHMADAAHCRQLAQQVDQAVSQCIQAWHQTAQMTMQQQFQPSFNINQQPPLS